MEQHLLLRRQAGRRDPHAASGDLVLPAHFPHPGRVVRDGASHRFEPVMLEPIAAAKA